MFRTATRLVQVAAFPRRHTTTREAFRTSRRHLVAIQHFQCIAPDLGLVVLYITGREQHRLITLASRTHTAIGLRPRLKGLRGKVRQQLVAVHAKDLLHEPTMCGHAIHRVRHTKAQARHAPREVGITKHAFAQRHATLLGSHRLVAMHQLREVELKLVPDARRVRTLHFAQLALEALIHDAVGLVRRDLARIAFVLLIQELEQVRERIAVLEAHATAIAQLEGALDL